MAQKLVQRALFLSRNVKAKLGSKKKYRKLIFLL